MGIDQSITSFEKRGYVYQDVSSGDTVITPSGSVYLVDHLYDGGCPLCEGCLEDNPSLEEVICSHSGKDEREIKESKVFKNLVEKKQILEFKRYLE